MAVPKAPSTNLKDLHQPRAVVMAFRRLNRGRSNSFGVGRFRVGVTLGRTAAPEALRRSNPGLHDAILSGWRIVPVGHEGAYWLWPPQPPWWRATRVVQACRVCIVQARVGSPGCQGASLPWMAVPKAPSTNLKDLHQRRAPGILSHGAITGEDSGSHGLLNQGPASLFARPGSAGGVSPIYGWHSGAP